MSTRQVIRAPLPRIGASNRLTQSAQRRPPFRRKRSINCTQSAQRRPVVGRNRSRNCTALVQTTKHPRRHEETLRKDSQSTAMPRSEHGEPSVVTTASEIAKQGRAFRRNHSRNYNALVQTTRHLERREETRRQGLKNTVMSNFGEYAEPTVIATASEIAKQGRRLLMAGWRQRGRQRNTTLLASITTNTDTADKTAAEDEMDDLFRVKERDWEAERRRSKRDWEAEQRRSNIEKTIRTAGGMLWTNDEKKTVADAEAYAEQMFKYATHKDSASASDSGRRRLRYSYN